MPEVSARMCRTASTMLPEPASPFVRIIAAPSPMRRSASPRSRAPHTNGTRKANLSMWKCSSAGVRTSDSSMKSTASASRIRASTKWPIRALAMTGIETAFWISLIFFTEAIRATPPSRRMSAGTRSSAITDVAPASSAIFACSAVVTSMITPPLSISARPMCFLSAILSSSSSAMSKPPYVYTTGTVAGSSRPRPRDRGRADDPPEAQPRKEDLREGADVDHDPVHVGRLEGHGRPGAVVEAPVEAVLDDRHVVAHGHLEQPPPGLGEEREAGRVVGARLAIEELRRVALEQALEDFNARPHRVPRHGRELGAEGPEHLEGAGVRRLLDRDGVALVDEGARDQVEPLLRPVDDQDLLRPRLEAEPQEIGRQVAPERRVATRRVVLEQRRALVANDLVEHPPERVGGEEPAVGHAAGERDHRRVRRRRAHERARPLVLGGDDLRAPGEERGPVEGRRRQWGGGREIPVDRGGPARGAAWLRGARGAGTLDDERALADVGARPAGGDELLVRLGDRAAVHAERVRELAGRGQLHPRGQQPLADESLEVRLDLARQWDRLVPVERDIHSGHPAQPF